MPCQASSVNLNPIVTPPKGIPGFGSPFSPIQIPLPDFDLPTDLIEDLLDLMKRLGALFPSGLFKANTDNFMKSVLDVIASILNQIAPFLSFYNFIMALLNLIICIIEVLCAIPNPLAVASKLIKLFQECLPPFLNLFPWLALIAMILALLLLILALITYIIETILAIIKELIANIIAFGDAVTLNDADATLAIAQKIASLLCFIENLMAVFIAIAAILAIIQALAAFAGSGICDDEDSEGCCPPEICPSFLKENKEISVPSGQLEYNSQIGVDVSGIPGIPAGLVTLLGDAIAPIRKERWQIFSDELAPEVPISLIVTPTPISFFGGVKQFYPDQEYTSETPPNRAPYTVDVRVTFDPASTGFQLTDGYGEREFLIQDCVVVRKPRLFTYNYANVLSSNTFTKNGVFDIEGGLVFESDGTTPYMVDGYQATLNTFIHRDSSISDSLPSGSDTDVFSDVTFIWKPQHAVLAGNNLITVGCIPEVTVEKAVTNAFIFAEGVEAILDRLQPVPDGESVPSTGNFLPNVLGAQECVLNAIAALREDISLETIADFQATVETCMGDLKDQTAASFCDALIAGVSQFKSTFTIDPDAQFVSRVINVAVELRDGAGTLLSTDIPEDCLDDILDKLGGDATFGTLSDFSYDGSSLFIATISSDSAGDGTLTISFDGNTFSTINQGSGFNEPSTITVTELNYSFVDAPTDRDVRRGPEDIVGD